MFGMRSLTFFVPLDSETVLYSWEALCREGVLQHLIDLYKDEWANFCNRVFHGAAPAAVAHAFGARGRSLARLFLTGRAATLERVRRRYNAWPPGPKNEQWPRRLAEYTLTLGYTCIAGDDPPPPIPPDWQPQRDGSVPFEEELLWDQVEFWCQQQVRCSAPSDKRWKMHLLSLSVCCAVPWAVG